MGFGFGLVAVLDEIVFLVDFVVFCVIFCHLL